MILFKKAFHLIKRVKAIFAQKSAFLLYFFWVSPVLPWLETSFLYTFMIGLRAHSCNSSREFLTQKPILTAGGAMIQLCQRNSCPQGFLELLFWMARRLKKKRGLLLLLLLVVLSVQGGRSMRTTPSHTGWLTKASIIFGESIRFSWKYKKIIQIKIQ